MPDTEDALELWDRQPVERTLQYTRFCAYRDMIYLDEKGNAIKNGKAIGRRSLVKLAAKLGVSKNAVADIASKWNWTNRADAYDKYMERRIRESQEEAIIRMREMHALVGANLIQKATARLMRIPVDEMDAQDIARFVDSGVKI